MKDIGEEFHPLLRLALEGYGVELEDLLAEEEPIHLGYVARSGGKPLLKSNYIEGNIEFLEALGEDTSKWALVPGIASMDYGLSGEPLVRVTLRSVSEEEEEDAKEPAVV